MPKFIILIGLFITVIGFVLYLFPDSLKWFGNLPGDIKIQRDNFSLYIPVTTMIIISIVISLISRLFR
jgi:hypothetical protein